MLTFLATSAEIDRIPIAAALQNGGTPTGGLGQGTQAVGHVCELDVQVLGEVSGEPCKRSTVRVWWAGRLSINPGFRASLHGVPVRSKKLVCILLKLNRD